ncbi:MAG: hypothetical protein WBG10_01390, partial [Pseudolabrys sp.]
GTNRASIDFFPDKKSPALGRAFALEWSRSLLLLLLAALLVAVLLGIALGLLLRSRGRRCGLLCLVG